MSTAPELRILHVGDVVGPRAAAWLTAGLPALRSRLGIDLVIVNAENAGITAADPGAGFGMPKPIVDALLAAGADVITSGNHGFDAPDAPEVLAHERVLRPLNLPDGHPGKGSVTITVAGTAVTVINLGSPAADMEHAAPLEYIVHRLPLGDTTVIDLHGDATWEKMVFAAAMDGRVAAVLGTHTHEPTERLHLLPGGTAFVADVGMTGPSGYPGGFPLDHFAARFTGADRATLPPFALADGSLILGAVLLTVRAGRTTAIRRVRTEELGEDADAGTGAVEPE